MTASRAESQQPHYSGRRRSNTAQSIFKSQKPIPQSEMPLLPGAFKVFNLWVHDPAKESTEVIFNQSWWPGVTAGDMLRITGPNDESTSGILFIVPKDDSCMKPQLQISVPHAVAETFGWRNNGEVTVTKVERETHYADYVEFVFQDQYLGRGDMWRLGKHLDGQCVYTNQEILFIGAIAAKIQNIFIGGKKVTAACMTSKTKAIYRSLSAKVMIFIQVCRELYEFAGDGERYNEKVVHSFLPALFTKWREAGTNHIVTIVLISRVYYDQSEIDYAAGPLRRDEYGRWYKDFFKVITDLEVVQDWKPTLVSLKNSFWDFHRDILLTHHFHRASIDPSALGATEQVRLVGEVSCAHDGPVLEALNLALNPTETHYIDRSLSLTGATTLLITPGTGYYRVSKQLLRLTTTRMLDQGFGLDIVSLAKPPLHQSPVFSFEGFDPELKTDKQKMSTQPHFRTVDPLWGGDEATSDNLNKTTFWWEPFWVSMSFWDGQMDLPFRRDRFIARAKMYEIQMLGLLEQDVLSSIEVPFLPDPDPTKSSSLIDDVMPTKARAAQFDLDVFRLGPDTKSMAPTDRGSLNSSHASSGHSTVMPSSSQPSTGKRTAEQRDPAAHRSPFPGSRIPPIEESPRRIIEELPSAQASNGHLSVAASTLFSTSPSQSSLRSIMTSHTISSTGSETAEHSRDSSRVRTSLSSKLTPSWLLNSFRSRPSEPETSIISASGSQSLTGFTAASHASATPVGVNKVSISYGPISTSRAPAPVSIKNTPTSRFVAARALEEGGVRPSYRQRSPIGTPPRDDVPLIKRRGSHLTASVSSASPSPRSNPSRPQLSVSLAQASLARRWQHMFPQILYKHTMKWKSLVTPGCLPLSVEYLPPGYELDQSYDVFSYDFVVDLREMHPFLVKVPETSGGVDEQRRAWALAVIRGMAVVRLVQGFQFILRPPRAIELLTKAFRRTSSLVLEDDMTPIPLGAAEILHALTHPIYLSMSNEIHRIAYTGETIQVYRYVRRMPPMPKFVYECLIWPKLGEGYTELKTMFSSQGLENYGWNRLDMLVAGYEHHFDESLRYWRTRFVVIPTSDPPSLNTGPSGENLNDEETRILGIEKLAEIFTKLRWVSPDEKGPPPPIRFLPTTLGPAMSVRDEALMSQLDEIHAAGPLRKKMKSEREISEMSLAAIAKAMREDDGVPIKDYQWHGTRYPDSFTGFDFVSWLVREFRDVSSRAQSEEIGARLMDQGLFEHCRGHHGFLDGHYFYRLKGEFAVPSTPRGWFKSKQASENSGYYPSSVGKRKSHGAKIQKKRLILSQTITMDIDPHKRSDQAEAVILHHDIIHNPATVLHFELQWIGTTARCIEDQLRQWSRVIERYGLKLVEAYVTQISDIRERNAFQSCFPVRLAIPPPVVADLPQRVPEHTQTVHYFEYAILRRFGFILDIEASDLYPEHVDVVYSYRRSPYKYSQFVHRSGVAFVQVLGGSQGFLFLTNRLMGPGRMGTTMKSKEPRPAAIAEEIRIKLHNFCSDKDALNLFYDEELAVLAQTTPPEEPPPLHI